MRIYLDDDLDSNRLIGLLKNEGHAVVSPREVGMRGATDLKHLQYASQNGLVLLTANVSDFLALHSKWIESKLPHSGILVVYRENNPIKDLTVGQISKAVTEIERSGLPLLGALYNVNSWRISPRTA